MAKRKKKELKQKTLGVMNEKVHPHSAGIDLGAEELVVAIAASKTENNVLTYQTHTPDLHRIRD